MDFILENLDKVLSIIPLLIFGSIIRGVRARAKAARQRAGKDSSQRSLGRPVEMQEAGPPSELSDAVQRQNFRCEAEISELKSQNRELENRNRALQKRERQREQQSETPEHQPSEILRQDSVGTSGQFGAFSKIEKLPPLARGLAWSFILDKPKSLNGS